MAPRRYVLMITGPILVTSVLLLVLGGAAAWYVHRLNYEVSDLLDRNLECAVASQQLVLGIRDARTEMHRFIDGGNEEHLRAIVTIEQTTSQHLRDAEQAVTSDTIGDLMRQTRRNHDQFFAQFTAVMQDLPAAARQQKGRELVQAITDDVILPAEQLLQQTQQAAKQHTKRNRSVADNVGLALLMLGVCGAVGGLLAGYGIAHGIAIRIEQTEREATRSEQLAAVGQLAAGLAHELRNPLTAMRLLVEAGQDQSSGSGLDRRDLEVLDEEIARLEKLVESFLDFARPPRLDKAAIDARSLVERTLLLVGGPARQRGVMIDWHRPAEAVMVEADHVQMRQVLLNLLLNAMDAAGESGKVSVELETQSSAAAGRITETSHESSGEHRHGRERPWYGRIHVSDNGPGVPDEMKEKIFEPFVSSKETGMGLGLAVSRRIIEAHGGVITVADNPGGGARFTICLTRDDEHPASRLSSRAGSV